MPPPQPERLEAALPMLRCGDQYVFDAAIADRGRERQDAYRAASPFPHAVIDGVLPEAMLDRLLDHFPRPDQARVAHTTPHQYLKRGYRPDDLEASPCRALLYLFCTEPFVRWVENVSGQVGLVPDPSFLGGGLHEVESGGRLEVHADFNLHPRLGLARRVNVLVYLNRNWRPEYGGQLELWDRHALHCVRTIEPAFNRAVVFDTSRDSYHGHPVPVCCPAGFTRRSIALYYYGRTATEHLSIDTDWRPRRLAGLQRLLASGFRKFGGL